MSKQANGVDAYVGRRIRARRRALGLSQQRFGAAIGVSFQQVQKYESGGNRIGAGRLAAAADALAVPISYFYPGRYTRRADPRLDELAAMSQRLTGLAGEFQAMTQ